ncbi:M23 family metallopeptidase [candidate division KSB1 bacterium]|nr:M23 family metallopeptidase [candidate division KSB1 bacterium]NIR69178.1 M23 family metallopeptidase [candidate division KSB1 bacterium]NIS25689.1 M23 family metallopeptidase [candidate division KSB1 bacterium]NIT72557.1 M23 family metallopeptidase [candidate division KSB1 bacterium]NIU26366.1 M23 family metallopeptidase [candidate division KSB1 bacterium]
MVVQVVNHVRDFPHPRPDSGRVDWKTLDFRGNFVVIKHAEDEYSFLAHLLKKSICVKKGERVRQGQLIGLCGNSGHLTEPHLHFHIQDRANFYTSVSLPIQFVEIVIDQKPVGRSYLKRDQRVSGKLTVNEKA